MKEEHEALIRTARSHLLLAGWREPPTGPRPDRSFAAGLAVTARWAHPGQQRASVSRDLAPDLALFLPSGVALLLWDPAAAADALTWERTLPDGPCEAWLASAGLRIAPRSPVPAADGPGPRAIPSLSIGRCAPDPRSVVEALERIISEGRA
jgi:hypothetical protein